MNICIKWIKLDTCTGKKSHTTVPKGKHEIVISDMRQNSINMHGSCTTKSNTNTTSQYDLFGFEDEEVFDLAKSTRSLKRASSGFSCLAGVDEFKDKFCACPTKLS